jgi:hypothetical protein
MKGIVYLTGRMRGLPLFNFPCFDEVAARLTALGWDVINPAELDRRNGIDPSELPADWDWNVLPPGFNRDAVSRRDVDGVFNCTHYCQVTADRGLGTAAEVALCEWLERPRIDPDTGGPWEPEGVLQEAVRVTSGQRRADYDHALPNHERIALLWNSYLMVRKDARGELSSLDVAQMMILLKMARIAHRPTRDGFVDIAGYARCGSQIEGFEP